MLNIGRRWLVPVTMLNIGRGRPRGNPNFQGKPNGWWRYFRSKGPTRADIAQLPVAHAHTQGNLLWGHFRYLSVMRNDTFCTTIVRKNSGNCCARSLPVRMASGDGVSGDITSGHVTDVTSGSTTSHHLRKCGFVRAHILLPTNNNFICSLQ